MALEREAGVVSTRPPALTLPIITATSLFIFAALLVALHMLRPELNPTTNFVSEYAIEDYGFLMVTAFLAMSVASFSLFAGLWYSVPAQARSTTGLILIGIWAVGLLVLSIFPIGVGDTIDSTADIIHRMAALIVFLTVSFGALLVSRGFRQDGEWKPLTGPGTVLATLLLVGYVATFGGYAIDAGIEGLSQRVFLVTLVIWMGLVARQLWVRRSATS